VIEFLAVLGAAAALSTPAPPPMTACPAGRFFQPCVTVHADRLEPDTVELVPGQGV
jgi:hypothetical protein